MEKLGLKNPMAVPRIKKITINMGVGEALAGQEVLEATPERSHEDRGPEARADAGAASRSRASRCATVLQIGCKVTLRNERMYEFLDRLINVAMPRIRDFRGVSRRSFDGRGNYNLGVKKQIIFPEINLRLGGRTFAAWTSRSRRRRGRDDHGRALLEAFQVPALSGGDR